MPAIAAIIPAITALTALSGAAKKATDQIQNQMGGCDSSDSQPAQQASNTLMDSGMAQFKQMMEAMGGNAGGQQQNGGMPSFGGMRA